MAPPFMPAALTLLFVASARKPSRRERSSSDACADRSPVKTRRETAAGSPWASFERP